MKWLRLWTILTFCLTLFFLGLSFFGLLQWVSLIPIALLFCLGFFLILRSGHNGLIHLFLATCAGLTMLASWLEREVFWLILANLSALTTWDLLRFTNLLQGKELLHESEIIRQHMKRLIGVLAVSFGLAGLTMNLRLELNLWMGLFLGLIISLGVKQIIAAFH